MDRTDLHERFVQDPKPLRELLAGGAWRASESITASGLSCSAPDSARPAARRPAGRFRCGRELGSQIGVEVGMRRSRSSVPAVLPQRSRRFRESWDATNQPPAITVQIVSGLADPTFVVEIEAHSHRPTLTGRSRAVHHHHRLSNPGTAQRVGLVTPGVPNIAVNLERVAARGRADIALRFPAWPGH